MLEVTENAISNIKAYLHHQQFDDAVRITLVADSCAAPSLWLSVDEAKETDHTFDREGICFVLDRELSVSCGVITIDYIEKRDGGCGCPSGDFSVTSEKPLSRNGCGCSSNTCR